MYVIGCFKNEAPSFKNLTGILSNPVFLDDFNLHNSLYAKSSLTTQNKFAPLGCFFFVKKIKIIQIELKIYNKLLQEGSF